MKFQVVPSSLFFDVRSHPSLVVGTFPRIFDTPPYHERRSFTISRRPNLGIYERETLRSNIVEGERGGGLLHCRNHEFMEVPSRRPRRGIRGSSTLPLPPFDYLVFNGTVEHTRTPRTRLIRLFTRDTLSRQHAHGIFHSVNPGRARASERREEIPRRTDGLCDCSRRSIL